mgnify:CR=1 FL=1
MNSGSGASFLSAVFVDYDNIYLSLKRKDEDAARRFARSTPTWLRAIESGALITPTSVGAPSSPRRIVASRCYGDPVPRRNGRDNSTDMSSFTFVRHHFLRSGFEVVDCPPLTAQLKNSSDIRMVMDVRDFLTHVTHFDEFIILSSDADFTPVLHRLRAHARRTVIFANEHTAQPYTALCDGEVREQELINFLLKETPAETAAAGEAAIRKTAEPQIVASDLNARDAILGIVLAAVEKSDRPIPLESLADRAQRALGHEHTVGTGWAGSGSFRGFLSDHLPETIHITDLPPYQVYAAARHGDTKGNQIAAAANAAAMARESASGLELPHAVAASAPPAISTQPTQMRTTAPSGPVQLPAPAAVPQPITLRPPMPSAPAIDTAHHARTSEPPQAQTSTRLGGHWAGAQPTVELLPPKRAALNQQPVANLQRSIARIHEACQAPPLAPPEYRLLFEMIVAELKENPLDGMQTIVNIAHRAQQRGLDVKRDDIRFVLDVISEADPWFDQGVSANLFAGRFRNFVVARCRSQGLSLSADELDLIDAWFACTTGAGGSGQRGGAPSPAGMGGRGLDTESRSDRSWELQAQRSATLQPPVFTHQESSYPVSSHHGGGAPDMTGQDITSLPRIIRTRLPS